MNWLSSFAPDRLIKPCGDGEPGALRCNAKEDVKSGV